METNQKQFLYRLYLVASVLIVLGLGIGYKIFHIQYIEGDNYRQLAKNKTIQNFTITPERGNIFSDDGSLLAASSTSYDIYFDAVTVSNSNFLNYSIISRMLKIENIGLPNLLLSKRYYQELLQKDFNKENILKSVNETKGLISESLENANTLRNMLKGTGYYEATKLISSL